MVDKQSLIRKFQMLYRGTLFNDVIPFWMEHGLDKKHGGISNVLDDEGNVISYDKYIWSQGRALWTFSALYNRIEKRAEWLAFANHIYRYLSSHGRDCEGRWMYRLDVNGNVLEHDASIYVDGFVMNGLGEYYAATGCGEALKTALDTFDNTIAMINCPGSYQVAPYNIPEGMKTLGVPMIFSFFYYNLGEIANRPDIRQAGMTLAHEIMDAFYVSEKDAIVEFVTLDGTAVDTPEGRACVPGHAIEAMWFLIAMFEEARGPRLIKKCCSLIRRHLELGWDEEYGGLRLALDIDGKGPIYWERADCKPWWVHVEGLVATLYAYVHTGEDWCLEWHQKIQDFAYSHFPARTGEWTQWLDRSGGKTESGALPVKDPFHLPRAMIYLMELTDRLLLKSQVFGKQRNTEMKHHERPTAGCGD